MEVKIGAKRLLTVALGALAFACMAMSVAWACTSDAYINVSNSAPMAGEVVHVSGADFVAGAEVHMRWGAHDGPLLATTTVVRDPNRSPTVEDQRVRGTIAVDVTIPADAAPGRHVLYAVSPGAARAPRAINIPGEPPATDETEQAPVTGETEQAPATDETEQAPATDETEQAPVTDETVQPAPAPASPPAQPEPVAVAPAPEPEPAPAPVRGTSPEPAPEPEPVPAGVAQAVAPEPEPASTPAVPMDWRYTHGALLTASATPVAAPDMDWRYTHGALMHAVPAAPESPDTGAFADAVAEAERSGHEWAGVPQQGSSGVGAGIGLLAVGLMLLFGGFTVAAVARRREKVPVTGK